LTSGSAYLEGGVLEYDIIDCGWIVARRIYTVARQQGVGTELAL